MTVSLRSGAIADVATDDAVFRKAFRRLIWYLFILLIVSFMDRINIAFAALTMNKDLVSTRRRSASLSRSSTPPIRCARSRAISCWPGSARACGSREAGHRFNETANSGSKVDRWNEDDGSGRQRWQIQ